MRKLTVTHVFETDVETYWKTFFDPEYNKKLYLEGLGFPHYEMLENSESKRRMKVTPKMNVPGPVAKILGDNFGYEEQGTFDKAGNIYRWKMVPNTLADKMTTTGFAKIEQAGDGKVKRTSEANIEAKVFAVGGLLESTAEKEVRESWEKEAAYMSRYLKEKK